MFEIVDHTADVAFVVKGKDKNELVKDAAKALYFVYFDKLPETQNCTKRREIHVEGINFEDTLITFLNELVYFFDAHKLVFCDIENLEVSDTEIRATVLFSDFSPKKHIPVIYVKAVSYGGGKIQVDENGNISLMVIVDI